jgi:hypothetical protein
VKIKKKSHFFLSMEEGNTIQLYVSYFNDYKVLLCRLCKHCISPIENSIRRHFRIHHKSIALNTRRAIIQYGKLLQLIEPEEINSPVGDIEAIRGLELSAGLCCQEKYGEEKCHHCCITEGSMKIHCIAEHGWIKSKGISWKQQSVQTFFKGPLIKYFPVTMNDDNEESMQPSGIELLLESLLDEAKERDIEQQRTLNEVSDIQHLVTLTPWLRRTGWPRMFAGKDMDVIVSLGRLPNKEDYPLWWSTIIYHFWESEDMIGGD